MTSARRLPWLDLVRHRNKQRRVMQVDGVWPPCLECCVPVDKVSIEDITSRHIFIRAWHHGKEDVVRVDFDHMPDDEDIERACKSLLFFPPGALMGTHGR